MSSRVIVCCVKWGTKYPPLYVNRLRNMVARHLSHAHEFVCLTEDPAGLATDIRTLALPGGPIGFWNKISLFRRDLFEPGATIVYLDLDLVIVGAIDFLLEQPGGLVVIRDWGTIRGAFNSSVMRFNAGEYSFVHDHFHPRAEEIVASGRFNGDQDWIAAEVPDAKSFPAGKILSYKRDLNSNALPLAKKLGLDFSWLKAPRSMTVEVPPGASIIVFHGKPDPEDVIDSSYGLWKRAPFVKEHWR